MSSLEGGSESPEEPWDRQACLDEDGLKKVEGGDTLAIARLSTLYFSDNMMSSRKGIKRDLHNIEEHHDHHTATAVKSSLLYASAGPANPAVKSLRLYLYVR